MRRWHMRSIADFVNSSCFCVVDGMDESRDEQICFDHHRYDIEMVQEIEARIILHWNYRNLREIPREVLEYGVHLKEMYLKRNLIQALPADIGKLSNLTNLYLVGNQLRSLPPEMGQLRSLQVADLSQNRLSDLPDSIGDLSQLQQLILTHNRLQSLPPGMGRLENLIFLELSGNRIRSLPETLIQGLVSLQELGLDQNPICRIPRNLSRLKRLRYLSVCEGNLSFLPAVPFQGFKIPDSDTEEQSTSNYRRSSPQFRFDGNPNLNYLPFWVPQCLGPDTEAFGCCVETDIGSNSFPDTTVTPRIHLQYKGKPHTLHFEEDLCKISRSSTKEPCSLLELCLRQVYFDAEQVSQQASIQATSSSSQALYESKSRNEYDLFHIPANLTRLLTTGPVTLCFLCSQPIFTQVWPLVFTLPEGNGENPNPDQNDNQPGHLLDMNNSQNRIALSVICLCSSKCDTKVNDGTPFRAKSYYPNLNFIMENKLRW